MNLSRKLELLDEQITVANAGHPSDFAGWKDQTDVVLRTVMGQGHPLYERFIKVKYTAGVYVSGMDTSGYRPAGVKSVISILNAAKEELELVAEVDQTVCRQTRPRSSVP